MKDSLNSSLGGEREEGDRERGGGEGGREGWEERERMGGE